MRQVCLCPLRLLRSTWISWSRCAARTAGWTSAWPAPRCRAVTFGVGFIHQFESPPPNIYIYIYMYCILFLGWRPSSAPPDHGPPFHRSVGVKVTEWGPASEIYSLGFLAHICWNRRFFGEQVSSRKLLRRVFPKELLPISTCYFV